MKAKLFLPFLCGLTVIAPLISGGCSSTRADPNAAPDELPVQGDGGSVVGTYHVPPLPGWDRQATPFTMTNVESVTYRREVDGTKIQTKFVFFNWPELKTTPEMRVDSVEKLRASADDADKHSRQQKQVMQMLEARATSYQNLPAYLTRRQILRNGKITEARLLRVADGKGGFWFSQVLTSSGSAPSAISPQARSEAEVAWKTLTQGLKAAPDNG